MNCPNCQRPVSDLLAKLCPNCRQPLGANPQPTQMMQPVQPQKTTRMSLTGEVIEEEVRVAPQTIRAALGREEPLLEPDEDPETRERERKVLTFLKVFGGIAGALLLFGTVRLLMNYSAQQQRFEESVTVKLSSPEIVTKEAFVSFRNGSSVRLYKTIQMLGDAHLLAEAAVEFNKGYFEPEGEYSKYRDLAKNLNDPKITNVSKHGNQADVTFSVTSKDGKTLPIHGVAHLIQGPDDSKWRLDANKARINNPGTEEHQIVRNLFDDLFGIKHKE